MNVTQQDIDAATAAGSEPVPNSDGTGPQLWGGAPTPTPTEMEQVLPWWPVSPGEGQAAMDVLVCHAATKLPDGRLSFIVDPGAWTNLIGGNLARALTRRVLASGYKPEQHKMNNPLCIQGVGHGHQECSWELDTPIAVGYADGTAHQHRFSSPIVDGSGAELPGLLGLRSIEGNRGIMDTGNKKLIFPGKGEVEYALPPGSIVLPLEKAPSGHLVLPVDEFERLAQKKGGLPEENITMHTTGSSSSRDGAPTESPRVSRATSEEPSSVGAELRHPY